MHTKIYKCIFIVKAIDIVIQDKKVEQHSNNIYWVFYLNSIIIMAALHFYLAQCISVFAYKRKCLEELLVYICTKKPI